MAAQAQSEIAHAPPDAEAAAFVKRFESAWATSRVEALLELLTDDVALIQPGMPSTHGKEAARELFRRLLRLIPDLHVEVHRWAARDEVLFISSRWSARSAPAKSAGPRSIASCCARASAPRGCRTSIRCSRCSARSRARVAGADCSGRDSVQRSGHPPTRTESRARVAAPVQNGGARGTSRRPVARRQPAGAIAAQRVPGCRASCRPSGSSSSTGTGSTTNRRRYGDVVRFSTLFYPCFVMVFDPESGQAGVPCASRSATGRGGERPLGPVLGERSVLLLDGAEHLRQRRLMLPPFHGQRMREYEAVDAGGHGSRDRLVAGRRDLRVASVDAVADARCDHYRRLRDRARAAPGGAQATHPVVVDLVGSRPAVSFDGVVWWPLRCRRQHEAVRRTAAFLGRAHL